MQPEMRNDQSRLSWRERIWIALRGEMYGTVRGRGIEALILKDGIVQGCVQVIDSIEPNMETSMAEIERLQSLFQRIAKGEDPWALAQEALHSTSGIVAQFAAVQAAREAGVA